MNSQYISNQAQVKVGLFVVSLLLTSITVRADISTEFVEEAYDCLIEPFVVADVGSSTHGIIAELLVERGESVTKGQAIARLESVMEQAAEYQAEARSQMMGELVTREADFELARLDSARFVNLYKRGLAPSQQRDEAVAKKKIAHAGLVQALENQKLLLLDLSRTRKVLSQRTIKSPVDGVIVSQLAFPGELVFDNPIVTVAQISPLRVEVVLPARLFGSIKVGEKAVLYPEINAELPLIAVVDVVDPLLDSRSGTFGIRLLLENSDLSIPAGQKCFVNFNEDIPDIFVPVAEDLPAVRSIPAELGAATPRTSPHPKNHTQSNSYEWADY